MCNLHKVLLLCGGMSEEHEVSLASAASVLQAMPERIPREARVIARDGRLLSAEASLRAIHAGRSDDVPDADAAGDPLRGLAPLAGDREWLVFPLLHGPNGEDGTVQGMLRTAGLPFIGSDVLASAAAMDKIVMKRLFASAGLPQVAWEGLTRASWRSDPAAGRHRLAHLPWPRFVKPANLGSSLGIAQVTSDAEQDVALAEAFRLDRRAIVEAAAVDARELEVAVLGNDAPEASPVGEITVPPGSFYDYAHKYTDGLAELRIPAPLTPEQADRARTLALQAYTLLDAAGLARVDLFLSADGDLLVNEVNTLPGFTRTSMYPRLWAAGGLAYPDLIERLLHLALERHEERAGP